MGEGSDPTDGDARVREEAYEVTADGVRKLVIFDPQNPLAWLISDRFGTPIDAEPRDQEPGDGEPTE